ncbi:MAG: hypothetical protein ACE5NN_03140 [Candidatus Bathyarchaeia archaeon]
MAILTLQKVLIVTPRAVSKSDLLIKDGYISRIGGGLGEGEVLDCSGCYILPGFRDQHIHDIKGFMEKATDPGRLSKVSRALASQGVTAFLIATLAAPTKSLTQYLRTIKGYMDSGRNGLEGARVEGVHVEGTFIRRECAGAQPCEYIIPPNSPGAKETLDAMVKTGAVRLVNIIPDFGVDLIEYAASKGVIVGCGHCLAMADQLADAFKSGLRYIVHLTNGAMGRSFKPFGGGGTYEGALVLPLFVELILDEYHIDFRYVSDIIWRRIQQGRGHEIIAVTDGIYPIEEEIPKEGFRMFSTLCVESEDKGVFVVKGRVGEDGSLSPVPPSTLCSSKLTMDKAFENLLNLLTVNFKGFMIDREALRLHEAMRYASLFTSSNQALLQGALNKTGSIEVGKLADLTVLRVEGEPGTYKLKVEKTLVAGKLFNFS